jgi:hypothetical protein
MPLDEIVCRDRADEPVAVVGDEVEHHAGLVGLKRALAQLAYLYKTFDVPKPCQGYLLDRFPATRRLDATRADLDGPGVALTPSFRQTNLADGLPPRLGRSRRRRAGEVGLARPVKAPLLRSLCSRATVDVGATNVTAPWTRTCHPTAACVFTHWFTPWRFRAFLTAPVM